MKIVFHSMNEFVKFCVTSVFTSVMYIDGSTTPSLFKCGYKTTGEDKFVNIIYELSQQTS